MSGATLARRLRTVERALGGVDGIEIEPERSGPGERDLDAVGERLDALCRAVRAIGECLDARGRARRADDGIESVRRAVEALPDDGDGTDAAGGDGDPLGRDVADEDGNGAIGVGFAASDPEASPDGVEASAPEESPVEWLDRAAAGGVAPPSVE